VNVYLPVFQDILVSGYLGMPFLGERIGKLLGA